MSKAQSNSTKARRLLVKMKRLLPKMKKAAEAGYGDGDDTMAIYGAAKELKSEIGELNSDYYYSAAKELLIDINYASVPCTAETVTLPERLRVASDDTAKTADPINPQHYASLSIEPIDVIEAWNLGFSLGNVVKYIARAGRKTPDTLVDLKKARWYLNREIAKREKIQ